MKLLVAIIDTQVIHIRPLTCLLPAGIPLSNIVITKKRNIIHLCWNTLRSEMDEGCSERLKAIKIIFGIGNNNLLRRKVYETVSPVLGDR